MKKKLKNECQNAKIEVNISLFSAKIAFISIDEGTTQSTMT